MFLDIPEENYHNNCSYTIWGNIENLVFHDDLYDLLLKHDIKIKNIETGSIVPFYSRTQFKNDPNSLVADSRFEYNPYWKFKNEIIKYFWVDDNQRKEDFAVLKFIGNSPEDLEEFKNTDYKEFAKYNEGGRERKKYTLNMDLYPKRIS